MYYAAIFLLDAHYEVYVWLGWWPEQKNNLLREANVTTGSAHARWLRDKKLALQTAQNYVKGRSLVKGLKNYTVFPWVNTSFIYVLGVNCSGWILHVIASHQPRTNAGCGVWGVVTALARYVLCKSIKLSQPIPTVHAHVIIVIVHKHQPQMNAALILTPDPQSL